MDRIEQELREELAACYRVFAHLGWTELIFNHISLRLPGPDHHFLINPFGLRYDEVTASNLLRIDLDGNVLSDSEYGFNPAGFIIHSAIHAARGEDASAVAHTHTTAGQAIAGVEEGLTYNGFQSSQMAGQVAYHDFEGVTVVPDEQERLVASLGDKPYLILRNHGLLTVGPTVATCWWRMWQIQRACEVQVAVSAMNSKPIELSPEVRDSAAKTGSSGNPSSSVPQMTFDALVRVIEAEDPSYKN